MTEEKYLAEKKKYLDSMYSEFPGTEKLNLQSSTRIEPEKGFAILEVSEKNPDGTSKKWLPYQEAVKEYGIENITLRRVLPNEISLDCDDVNTKTVIQILETNTVAYEHWTTKINEDPFSHAHIRFRMLNLETASPAARKIIKENVIREFADEEGKTPDLCMAQPCRMESVEFSKHHKRNEYLLLYKKTDGKQLTVSKEQIRDAEEKVISLSKAANFNTAATAIREEWHCPAADLLFEKGREKTGVHRGQLIIAAKCNNENLSFNDALEVVRQWNKKNKVQGDDKSLIKQVEYVYKNGITHFACSWLQKNAFCEKDCEFKRENNIRTFRQMNQEEAKLQQIAKSADIAEKINLPEILLPATGKLASTFANEVAIALKNTTSIFYRPDLKEIVEIIKIKTDNPDAKQQDFKYTGFTIVKPSKFITLAEEYFCPIVEIHVKKTATTAAYSFTKEKSMTGELANTILNTKILRETLPHICRIFTIPIPIIYNKELTFPQAGYDKRFYSWLPFDAPKISNPNMSLDEAKKIIDWLLREFCFLDEKQDKINAIAGLLTPFLRGLFPSFNTRTPVFFYLANRERSGKDFLAGVTGIVYEGLPIEETPISTSEKESGQSDEIRKKLLSAFINGRKRMHFSNNKGNINNAAFESAITNKVFSDRLLGKNETLVFDNEIDFSLSGNTGISFTPDFAARCRFINLFLEIEDANARKFDSPDLHEWVLANREQILSALFALVKNWFANSCKAGSIPFASFPDWSRICGGILEAANYGSPCIQNNEKTLNIGGDAETRDMKKLFELCYEKYPNKWIKKTNILQIIENKAATQSNEDKLEEAFGVRTTDLFSNLDLDKKAGQVAFGILLEKFVNRILSDIKLEVSNLELRANLRQYRFTKTKITKADDLLPFTANNQTLPSLPSLPPLPTIVQTSAIISTDITNQNLPSVPSLPSYISTEPGEIYKSLQVLESAETSKMAQMAGIASAKINEIDEKTKNKQITTSSIETKILEYLRNNKVASRTQIYIELIFSGAISEAVTEKMFENVVDGMLQFGSIFESSPNQLRLA